jgi:Na+-driven multidrug efflux pump
LGIAGAAWATAASQAISAVLCILYLRRKAPELIFARADCRMDGELLKQTAHFSFVTALHQLSLYIGKLLVQGAVNTGGTDMISAYTATTRIEGFANSFGDSGSAATSVLVAQNRGAGKEERVKESFRSSLFLMLAMGLAVPLIMYVSASTSVGFMLGTRSGAAFENARDYLKLVALFYTLCFTGNTFAGYFNGIGKVCVPFLGATSHIALRVVLSWLLVGKMGLPAVALATGLGWVLVNALCTFVKWRMEKKQKAAERNIM